MARGTPVNSDRYHFGLDLRRTGGEITPGNYRMINQSARAFVRVVRDPWETTA